MYAGFHLIDATSNSIRYASLRRESLEISPTHIGEEPEKEGCPLRIHYDDLIADKELQERNTPMASIGTNRTVLLGRCHRALTFIRFYVCTYFCYCLQKNDSASVERPHEPPVVGLRTSGKLPRSLLIMEISGAIPTVPIV